MFLLVAFGVCLYVGLNNLGTIKNAIYYAMGVLNPLLIGALIALVLNTPMIAIQQLLTWTFRHLFERKRKDYKPNARGIEVASLVLTVLLAVLIIYIIAYAVIPQLIESIKAIILQASKITGEIIKIFDKLEEYNINTDAWRERLSELDFNEILKKFTENVDTSASINAAGSIINTVISSASSIISGTFTAVTSVIFALYVLSNKRSLSAQMQRLAYAHLKKSRVDRAKELFAMSSDTFSSFISGQCLDAVLLGLMCLVTMALFGFPYAIAISAMITITAIIPYVGAFLGGAFGVLLMIINSPLQALLFVVLFVVVQQIDNHLVYPRVVGGSVGLPAIWTFVAVIVGGAVAGVIGMVLFIPIFSVIYTLIKANVTRRLEERGITVVEPAPEIKIKKPGRISVAVGKGFGKLSDFVSSMMDKTNNNNKK